MSSSNFEAHAGLLLFLGPVDFDNFLEQYWEKKPLLVEGRDHNAFRILGGLKDLDTLALYGRSDKSSFAASTTGNLNTDANSLSCLANMQEQFVQGGTLVFYNVETKSSRYAELVRDFERTYGTLSTAAIYFNRAGAVPGVLHSDGVDVYVFQVEGRKRWTLYSPQDTLSLPQDAARDYEGEGTELGEPLLDIELEAGQSLYIPRGIVHRVSSVPGTHSMHLSVSTAHVRIEEVLREAVISLAREQLALRKSFAQHIFCLSNDEVAGLLVQAVPSLLRRLRSATLARMPILADGYFSVAADIDTLNEQTLVQVKEPLLGQFYVASTDTEETVVRVEVPSRVLDCPVELLPAFEFMHEHKTFDASKLPIDLTTSDKVALVRALILDGYLSVSKI